MSTDIDALVAEHNALEERQQQILAALYDELAARQGHRFIRTEARGGFQGAWSPADRDFRVLQHRNLVTAVEPGEPAAS